MYSSQYLASPNNIFPFTSVTNLLKDIVIADKKKIVFDNFDDFLLFPFQFSLAFLSTLDLVTQ